MLPHHTAWTWKTPTYLHQRSHNDGSSINEWIMGLAVPIQSHVGHRFPTRLMTYIPMYDLRPDLVCRQCIVDRPAARLEREWDVNVSNWVTLSVNWTHRHAPVVWAVASQLRNVWWHLKSNRNITFLYCYCYCYYLPLSQIFPTIDSLPTSGLTPRTSQLDRFFWASPFLFFF